MKKFMIIYYKSVKLSQAKLGTAKSLCYFGKVFVCSTAALCLLIIMSCSNAFAHKVNVFAYAEGDTVYTESYFPDGRKVTDGIIKVYDTKAKMLLEGITDKNGQFSFKIPTRDDLKIVLEASLGHRNSYTLSASEMPDTIEKTQSPPLPKKDEKLPLKDIISGIGYIFGITGIIMFFLSRKRKDASTRNR